MIFGRHTKRYTATLFAAVVCLAMCVACGIDQCRVAMTDVDSGSWDDTITVSYENIDTTAVYDLSVVLHVSHDFDLPELPLNIEILTPDSMRLREDVTLATAAIESSEISYSKDVEAPYRRSIRLYRQGIYTISITPREPVAGVESAGVTFQPVKK